MIFLLPLLNSTTLKSNFSSALAVVPSSFTRAFAGANPSMPYASATVAPLSLNETTVPSCTEPTVNTVSNTSQGFSSNCLWPRLNLLFSASISRTTTSRFSPIAVNSDGCLTFLVQERSLMCTRPSTPSSSSTNTPKFVKFLTTALCFEPTGYFSLMLAHGSALSCLIPRDIFLSSLSRVRMLASTSSPTLRKSCALLRCDDHDISETWIRPSTPGWISMNAP